MVYLFLFIYSFKKITDEATEAQMFSTATFEGVFQYSLLKVIKSILNIESM